MKCDIFILRTEIKSYIYLHPLMNIQVDSFREGFSCGGVKVCGDRIFEVPWCEVKCSSVLCLCTCWQDLLAVDVYCISGKPSRKPSSSTSRSWMKAAAVTAAQLRRSRHDTSTTGLYAVGYAIHTQGEGGVPVGDAYTPSREPQSY